MQDPIPSEIDIAARDAARAREFGSTPRCENCLYSGRAAFVRVRRVQLHEHHLNGRVNDAATTVLLCLNCHFELHEYARDEGASLDASTNVLDRVASVLRMHAALQRLILDTQANLATDLLLLRESLDEHDRNWRQRPDAAP
jgi:hypothetical protein